MPRAALIGYGQIARTTHRPALAAAGCELVAVVEPDPARREEAGGLPGVRAVASLEALWAEVADIDFIDICTPPARHLEALLSAGRRGVHALCEKPLVVDGREMAALRALGAGERWAVGYVHNWLCAPAVATMVAWVRAGRIGPPTDLEVDCLRTRPASGAADASRPWRQDRRAAGGGILMDHGWHGLGILLRLAGDEPCRLESRLDLGALGLEETCEVRLAFTSGARGRFFATWRAQRRHNRLVARGPGGRIVLDNDRLELQRPGAPTERLDFPDSLAEGGYQIAWTRDTVATFLPLLADRAARRAPLDEAAEIVRIIDAAYQGLPTDSAAEGAAAAAAARARPRVDVPSAARP